MIFIYFFPETFSFNIFKNEDANIKEKRACFQLKFCQLCGIETGNIKKKGLTMFFKKTSKSHYYLSVIRENSVLILSDSSPSFINFCMQITEHLKLGGSSNEQLSSH